MKEEIEQVLYGQYFNDLVTDSNLATTITNVIRNSNANNDSSIIISVYVRKEDLFKEDFITKCEEISKLFSNNKHCFLVDEECNFTIEEWEKIKALNEKFKEKNIKFGFEDYGNIWSVSQVENANKNIEEVTTEINQADLSPIEKLMYAYIKISRRKYKSETKEEDSSISRSVFGVLNSDKIVCVGYAALLRTIVNQLGDENIQIFQNEIVGHENIVVHIKDSKYGVEGYYVLDPCWDSFTASDEINLNHFLIPIKDLNKQKSMYIADRKTTAQTIYEGKTPRKAGKLSLGADTVYATEELWNIAYQDNKKLKKQRNTEQNIRNANPSSYVIASNPKNNQLEQIKIANLLAEEFKCVFIAQTNHSLLETRDIKSIRSGLNSLAFDLCFHKEDWFKQADDNRDLAFDAIVNDKRLNQYLDQYSRFNYQLRIEMKISRLEDDNPIKIKFNECNKNISALSKIELAEIGFANIEDVSEFYLTKYTEEKNKSIKEEHERVARIRDNENDLSNTARKKTGIFTHNFEDNSQETISERHGNSAVLYSHMEENSSSINMNVMRQSIINIFKARKLSRFKREIENDMIKELRAKGLSEEEIKAIIKNSSKEIYDRAMQKIEQIADDIIKHNIERASLYFLEDANNIFVEEAVSQNKYEQKDVGRIL